MKLLLFGRAGPVADRLAVRAVRELRPDVFLQLTRTGLAVPAAAAAAEDGVPVRRYWPDFLNNRSEAMRIAVEQMTIHEHPLTTIVISPRRDDFATIGHITATGNIVIVGKFGTDREITWEQVPAKEPTSDQVLPERV